MCARASGSYNTTTPRRRDVSRWRYTTYTPNGGERARVHRVRPKTAGIAIYVCVRPGSPRTVRAQIDRRTFDRAREPVCVCVFPGARGEGIRERANAARRHTARQRHHRQSADRRVPCVWPSVSYTHRVVGSCISWYTTVVASSCAPTYAHRLHSRRGLYPSRRGPYRARHGRATYRGSRSSTTVVFVTALPGTSDVSYIPTSCVGHWCTVTSVYGPDDRTPPGRRRRQTPCAGRRRHDARHQFDDVGTYAKNKSVCTMLRCNDIILFD